MLKIDGQRNRKIGLGSEKIAPDQSVFVTIELSLLSQTGDTERAEIGVEPQSNPYGLELILDGDPFGSTEEHKQS